MGRVSAALPKAKSDSHHSCQMVQTTRNSSSRVSGISDSMGAHIHVNMQSHTHVIKNKSFYNRYQKASFNTCFVSIIHKA